MVVSDFQHFIVVPVAVQAQCAQHRLPKLLPEGTIAEVEAAVKQSIEAAAPGGGYSVCSSNALHPGVNPENCIAMFEAVKKFGLYGPVTVNSHP